MKFLEIPWKSPKTVCRRVDEDCEIVAVFVMLIGEQEFIHSRNVVSVRDLEKVEEKI